MKQIILLCANGMSSSLLVKKMIAASNDGSYKFEARPVDDALFFKNADCILLGPQVYFMLDRVKKIANCPVALIDSRVFGDMDGKLVIEQIEGMLSKNV